MKANTSLVGSIIRDRNDSLEQAELAKKQAAETYVEILGDPSRTSEADKQTLAEAMRILGKHVHEAHADANRVEAAHGHAKGAEGIRQARAVLSEKKEDLRKWQEPGGGRFKAQEQIKAVERGKIDAIAQAQALLDEKTESASDLFKIHNDHPHLVPILPPVPEMF